MYNKSLDTASIESMRKALAEVEVNESDRAKHYKGATPPEDMKNNRKGKGAQDMMKPADDAVANPAADEQDMVNKDAAKMTANVKVAKKRRNDKDAGDKDIVEPGTPMKDPAVVKPAVKESIGKTPGDKSYYNLQRAKELAKKAGHDYDKLPQYDRRHNDHKDYFHNKAKNESMDNKMFVLRKQAQVNQKRIDKGMKPMTPLHPDHKNLIKPLKKKTDEAMSYQKPKPGEKVKQTGNPGMNRYRAGKTPYQMRMKKMVSNIMKNKDKEKANEGVENMIKPQWILDAYNEMYKKSEDQIDELSMDKLRQYKNLAKADISRKKAKMSAMPTPPASDPEGKLKKRKGFKDLAKAKMAYKSKTDRELKPRGPGADNLRPYEKDDKKMRPSGPNIKKQMAVTYGDFDGQSRRVVSPAKKK